MKFLERGITMESTKFQPVEGGVCAAKGFAAAGVHCGIRRSQTKPDLALIKAEVRCAGAGCYTTNKVYGAPITVDREHLADGCAQAILVNSGNANTCAPGGVELARATCELAAQALGVAACRSLMSVRYARLNDMFREINVARGEGRVYDALDRFSKPDLLILDDFFTTPIENPLNAVDLFEILESREGRGSTMFASQLEPDQWYLRINSELCADSILNRAVEHARVLDIKGPNMREYTAGLKAEMEKGYWD
jgi:hypothetical protein